MLIMAAGRKVLRRSLSLALVLCLAAAWAALVGGAAPLAFAAAAARKPAAPEAKPSAKAWAFAAFADCRGEDERPKDSFEGVLREIREPRADVKVKFPRIEFAVGCGDLKLASDNHRNWDLWQEAFRDAADKPCLFPLIGNFDSDDVPFNRKTVLPAQKNVVGDDAVKYYVDWKNVRLIVSRDLPYVEGLIDSAPAAIEHVFVADHYPIFPRYAHEQTPGAGDAKFWNMLVKHRAKVRAFLVGHTHHYSRMRVADPAGKAKELDGFPDEEGGVYQIDCGNAGRVSHGEASTTLVEVMIDGKDVYFRVVQAPSKTPTEFRVADEWQMSAPKAE
jgi:hypothetical protein